MSITKLCKVTSCENKYHAKGYCSKHYSRLTRWGSIDTVKIKYTKNGEAINFFNLSLLIDSEDCILWKYDIAPNGYGKIKIKKKNNSVHRLALQIKNYNPDNSLYALHSCRNRNCFNYKHLRWGTHKDNMIDRTNDMTFIHGKDHHSTKLSEDDVLDIYHDDRSSRNIANDYDISKSAVLAIKNRRTWKHLNI